MAYFIVIGTSNDVKGVVDEIKHAHLQHNVITSGCVLSDDEGLYYHWDVFNEKGDETTENKEPIALHNALTNQISQFRALLPDDAIPNVFIVSKCFNEEEAETLQMVCEELYKIGGAKLSGLLVDIVLVGYDLNKPEDVTIRPHWRLLESLRGLGENRRFHTNILYINNMDYMGAATNVDSRVLSRFLCHWSKMVCAGGYDPKSTVQSHVYSIGMSEYQYDFRDLNEFFKLSAEESLLDRTLNSNPSADTQELVDTNYFKKIDINLPWVDGLCHIKSLWESYCTAEWDPSKPISENIYSVSRQELALAAYLNSFLKLYVAEELREIDIQNAIITQRESEKSRLSESLDRLNELPDEDETKSAQIEEVNNRISESISEIEACKAVIYTHEKNIKANSFIDADTFQKEYGTMVLLTEEDEVTYASNKSIVGTLINYAKSEVGIRVMREAVERATVEDKEKGILPHPYPASEVFNMGRVKEIVLNADQIPSLSQPSTETPNEEDQSERSGCMFWFKGLFRKKAKEAEATETSATAPTPYDRSASINEDTCKFLNDKLSKTVAAIRKADDVRAWWGRLCELIDKNQKRQAECRLAMDGEKDINDNYIRGKEGYRPDWNRKSISLIDMDLVRRFRDSDNYYKQNIGMYLDRWFDRNIESENRPTMLELIKHQVLDPLVGRFHTLHWDGHNPFVKEKITDEDMHKIIEHNLSHSKPFVEYIRLHQQNISSNLNIGFFSNDPRIPKESNVFKVRYNIGSDPIIPVYLEDFVNSLCVIQVMDIPDHVDALKDFKPRRDAELSRLRTDIRTEAGAIIGNAKSVSDKAKAIYDWICDNIAYDTTKQIHDAETCYRTKRGVCQAYSELYCYMAEAVGLTADIITGRTKSPDGKLSEDKHAWVFVYTNAYNGILIDPTWGAGAVDGVKFFKNEKNDVWFDVSPYWMIFSHFPDQQYWTKLDLKVSEDQFKKIPYVNPTKETDGKDNLFESLSKL